MSGSQRLPALDALRGLAVLLMVLYHTAFDLRFFYGWPLDVFRGGWWVLARTSAILFLLVAGICFTLSWEHTYPQHRLHKILRRFATIALAAAVISFSTWLIAPQDFVKFGILHLFALATLLLPLFAPLKYWNAFLGLLIILTPTLPPLLTLPTRPTTLAILLGSPPPSFSSLDYFPLIPWFGVILIGLALGHSVRNPSPVSSPAGRGTLRQVSAVWQSIGRHSLMIYLLHQPILLSITIVLLGPPQPLTLTPACRQAGSPSIFAKATCPTSSFRRAADRRGERESQPLLVVEEDVEFQNNENKPPKL